MARCLSACVLVSSGVIAGCSSPFDHVQGSHQSFNSARPLGSKTPQSILRQEVAGADQQAAAPLATIDDYIRFALLQNPEVESAYQEWVAAAERLPQVSALPDPRVSIGVFLDEVETRTGPQQARVGVKQTIPWPAKLADRRDAEARAAKAAWFRFQTVRLQVEERVVASLYEIAYLDAAIGITQESRGVLGSFEQIIRARYRVGQGSHPELIRAQLEIAQLDDRLSALRASRPPLVSELNVALNREQSLGLAELPPLPALAASSDAEAIMQMALQSSPALHGLDERIEEQRIRTRLARAEGTPDFTVGFDYIVTDEAANSAIAESGDDPILLSLGVNVPIWRGKISAGVRESIARRLAISHRRADQANRLGSAVQWAWFEHTDADRRVRLYRDTLIPKGEQSLRASLASYRAGQTDLLDLLDTQRTLLEFALAAERARADRAMALAALNTLVGEQIPAETADKTPTPTEVQP